MEKGQSELTDKIRSAIKKKLSEINVFVDNELPDYIMILVANKRSKSHMEKDLNLFLGKDTAEFTNWLWDLVNNLKVNSKPKRNAKVLKSEDENSKNKNVNSDEDADVLDYDLGEQESDLCQDDENNSLDSRPLPLEHPDTSEVFTPSTVHKSGENVMSKDVNHQIISKTDVYPIETVSRIGKNSNVMVTEQNINPEVEYDPAKPEFVGNVSSVVHVTHRKNGRPASLQPNKLLLRAVDDATKSVLDGKSLSDFYKPTPIKVLPSSKVIIKSSHELPNLVNVQTDSKLDFNSEINYQQRDSSVFNENSTDSNISILENEDFSLSKASLINRTIHISPITADLGISEMSSISLNADQISTPYTEENHSSPHFIVTLEGVDFSSLKRKYVDSNDESMEIDEESPFLAEEDICSDVPMKRQKVSERCKYWPACKNSDNCAYYHPTVPCKTFPDCKFGDKCLYIHPKCKFDALCSKKDCPFTHASRRKFSLQPPPVKIRSPQIVCKYFPKCIVKNCAFIHPKLCRYGTKCRLPVCSFGHFNIPSRSQMTWKANVLKEVERFNIKKWCQSC
ncbi:zinc finger CCCH domain-containing protein 14 [Trichonephila clavata]|uniref:Zinc finger CCCH domain-containing protein 14 n=1 Tax=Trichonephila clavata TaxID=2740835 RepID=A0A8X6M3C0_TRICU|nr:zinc finger CCCH domain-containing protein 14 [Trichonephila clavata]